jgi:Na+/H+-dicarboxylate symporter
VAVAQFSGVSVPGGSIIVILPFLTQYLGFTNEMCSMIIALSIFLDPVGTANNVLGNGAFAMIVYRAQDLVSKVRARVSGQLKPQV